MLTSFPTFVPESLNPISIGRGGVVVFFCDLSSGNLG